MEKKWVSVGNDGNLLKKELQVNRQYKDEIFRIVFSDKKDLLQLYNAINGTNYTDENDLQVNTLENALLIGVKNDLSFILSQTLNLYEQQSTIGPNMPLRGLIYFADLYSAYIQQNNLHIYGTKLIKLPLPQYIVFYNGTAKQPDILEMKLSDAFEIQDKEGCLECKAIMININLEHNKELLNSCNKLKEYAQFVDIIRSHLEKGDVTNVTITHAMDKCIEAGILVDILKKNRAEIMNILSKEYYEKNYWALEMKAVHAEAREQGLEQGREQGRELGRIEGIYALIMDNLEEDIQIERIVEKLQKIFSLEKSQANEYLTEYLVNQKYQDIKNS